VTISNFPSAARFFFDRGRDLITRQNPDPAGYGGDVGYYISTSNEIEAAKSRFTTAYDRAVKANSYQVAGNTEAAIAEWRKIFGDAFPTYG
jgi:hypothetical protein